MRDKLLQIINHYGIMKQLKYIHSEYFELDEAIIDYEDLKYFKMTEKDGFAYKKYLKNHIAEELADVMNMLKQFQYLYEIEDKEIEDIMNYKIDRQLERIENEEKEH